MKKICLTVLTFLIIFGVVMTDCTFADSYSFQNSDEMKSTSAVGNQKIAVKGRDDTYITANTEKGYLYLVDGNGNKLIGRLFTGVFNTAYLNRYIITRFYGVEDFSGFAVLGGSQLYPVIVNNNYYYISTKYFRNGYNIVCEKRDDNGELKADCYRFSVNSSSAEIFDYSKAYYPDDYECSTFFAGERSYPGDSEKWRSKIKAADEAGLLIEPLRYRYLSDDITRYELACITVQAVLKKSGKDIYDYMADNSISLNYDKYVDIVSPDVLLAEQLGLITPGENGYFNPETKVTRQEAACSFYRLCQLFGVETTDEKPAIYDDDCEIDASARDAVYAVSNTRIEDTYIMPPGRTENSYVSSHKRIYCFLPNDGYTIEKTLVSVWRIFDFYNLETTEIAHEYDKYIGCGIYLFQGENGKWGAETKDGTVIVEPAYELAGFETKAVSNVFVLSDEKNNPSNRNNTYYVFDTEGNLLNTIHYGTEEMTADGKPTGSVYAYYASGTNLLFWTYDDNPSNEEFIYMKRLVSGKTAAEEYENVMPYGDDGCLRADMPGTDDTVLLNPDGTLNRYFDKY
ncbi:MAG: S-layer homology domain-containing protein [Clostridiales bacterium]|nr:S-layer homology domain-containing protein [Clostridiales bacterium]